MCSIKIYRVVSIITNKPYYGTLLVKNSKQVDDANSPSNCPTTIWNIRLEHCLLPFYFIEYFKMLIRLLITLIWSLMISYLYYIDKDFLNEKTTLPKIMTIKVSDWVKKFLWIIWLLIWVMFLFTWRRMSYYKPLTINIIMYIINFSFIITAIDILMAQKDIFIIARFCHNVILITLILSGIALLSTLWVSYGIPPLLQLLIQITIAIGIIFYIQNTTNKKIK